MVVVSGTWVKNVVSFPINGELITTVKMAAKAVLICRPNSHPFQERTLSLEQPVKIGRSVARARAVPNNAIFDCKVLSRNHALLWYENGKFYLQDTKSSNGTFVNNQRLSKGAEESPPREVCSGDIVQFGVDVMENARKVTHGCIVATVKLYLPDGKEAKASPSTSVVSSVGMVPLEDLYQLNIFLQEALQKEHMLENKLATLQKIVESTRLASELAWKALIDEDRLLSRVETLETQLLTTSKNFGEDKLREELRKLQDDKSQYQGTAKESLQKILEEKLDALLKLQALELNLSNSESECAHLKQLCEQGQQDLQELAQKFSAQLQKVEELTSKIQESDEQNKETSEKLEAEKKEIQHGLEVQTELCHELQLRLDALQADGNLTHQKMSDLQSHLQLLKSNEENEDIKEGLDNASDHPTDVILDCLDPSKLDNAKEVVEDLHYKLQNCQESLRENKDLLTELQGSSEKVHIELVGAEDDVKLAKVHLETVRSEEDLSQAKCKTLQERIDGIGLEIDLVSSEIDTNRDAEGDLPDTTGQIARLKAERANLQELLAEVRTKKKTLEEQKEIYEMDLNAANTKVKKITEEANTLKQQLLAAQTQVENKTEIAEDLNKQIEQLEASLGEQSCGMGALQDKLRDEIQRGNKHESANNALRQELMDSQQASKQYCNEAAQMRDRLKTVQASHAEALKNWEQRKQQELKAIADRCAFLESEITLLREDRAIRITLADEVERAKLREEELLRRLEVAGAPREVTHDQLEEELVEIKTNYTSLSGTLQKVRDEFEDYRSSHPAAQSRFTEILDRVPVLAISIALLAIGVALMFMS